MYLEHFGLRRDPFASDVDPRAFHPTRHHAEALDFLAGAIRDGRPLAILEGGRGTGKTMVLRVLDAELPPPYRTVLVDGADAGTVGLSVSLARALAVDSGTEDEAHCGEAVGTWLASRLRAGDRVVVVIDRAEGMTRAWISEIAALAGERPLPVRFVLAVDGDADSRLDGDLLRADAVRHRLVGIERAGLSGYLRARLMAAGAPDPGLFPDAAVAALWELTDGVPARVDVIAGRALQIASGSREQEIGHELVLRAAERIAAGKPPSRPRPVVRPMRRSHEEEQRQEHARPPRGVAAAGGGHGGGTWSPASSRESPPPDPIDEEPPDTAAGRPGVEPGFAGRGSSRTYRASADPQSEIEIMEPGEQAPRRARGAPPQRRPAARSRPRTDVGPSSGEDPFRDAEPAEPPFGPELLPVLSDPHGLAAEWFRVLRLRVEDWLEAVGGAPRTLLVTSSEPDAGKTFVSSNLALLLANEPGLRVLLVDGDLRQPRFGALFGVPRRPGFADALARRVSIEDSVRLVPETGLSVLPAGRPGNPRDLMGPERLEPALAAMKELADLVIIDSPPMEPMVDARSMATVVDGVMMVVRAGRTRAPALQRSLQTLSAGRFVGAVITGVKSSQAERAYGQYRRSRG